MDYRPYSDLHGVLPDFHRETDKYETCIIAGDLTEYGKKGSVLVEMLEKLCERFLEVIFVPGNHEYYGTNIHTLESKLSKLTKHLDNLVVLQNGEYIEREGTRIIGATLWSDTSSIIYEASEYMNDYKYIRTGPLDKPWLRKLTPIDSTNLHKEHLKNIEKAILGHEGPCIVVTHHCPSFKSIPGKYRDSGLNPAFATEVVLEKWPDIWIHGHVHMSFDYIHNGCRILCNPGGYWGEVTFFSQLENRFTL